MSTALERLQYGFDRDSRRTWRRRSLTTGEDNAYGYDGLSQVTQAALGNLNQNASAISAVPAEAEAWDYDPTGNWRGYHIDANGAVILDQQRVHDKGNRLTQIDNDPSPVVLDRAGRMTQVSPDASGNWDESQQIKWDAWGRITQIKHASDGAILGSYAYDGLTRRTTRTVGDTTTHCYYSDAWRPLEERNDEETTAAMQYYWGARHRDDLVRRDRATTDGGPLDETRYVLLDYFSPAAITDESGTVTERYAFSAFGVRRILAPDFTPRTTSECAFEFAFHGQFLDIESEFLNYGYRYYSPCLGRWLSKDPLFDEGSFNIYAFCANGPTLFIDLLGQDFIAVGSNKAIHLGPTDVPGIGHLSISYWAEGKHCIAPGDTKNTTALTSQTDWQRGGTSVPNDAQIQKVIQLDFAIFYTYKSVFSVPFATPVTVSYIVTSTSGNADSYLVIEADPPENIDVAPYTWSQIESAAYNYPYAEHFSAPISDGTPALNWPNSKYSASYNDSNTFIRYLLNVIGKSVPANFSGRTYPGNDLPKPVKDSRPTPIYNPF